MSTAVRVGRGPLKGPLALSRSATRPTAACYRSCTSWLRCMYAQMCSCCECGTCTTHACSPMQGKADPCTRHAAHAHSTQPRLSALLKAWSHLHQLGCGFLCSVRKHDDEHVVLNMWSGLWLGLGCASVVGVCRFSTYLRGGSGAIVSVLLARHQVAIICSTDIETAQHWGPGTGHAAGTGSHCRQQWHGSRRAAQGHCSGMAHAAGPMLQWPCRLSVACVGQACCSVRR